MDGLNRVSTLLVRRAAPASRSTKLMEPSLPAVPRIQNAISFRYSACSHKRPAPSCTVSETQARGKQASLSVHNSKSFLLSCFSPFFFFFSSGHQYYRDRFDCSLIALYFVRPRCDHIVIVCSRPRGLVYLLSPRRLFVRGTPTTWS